MSAPFTIASIRTPQAVGLDSGSPGERELTPAFPARVSVWCLRVFGPTAVAGAVIAAVAPFMFVRVLGLVALVASVLAFSLHLYLLQHDHPAEWIAWRNAVTTRLAQLRARWDSLVAKSTDSSAAAPAPFKPSLVMPAAAREV